MARLRVMHAPLHAPTVTRAELRRGLALARKRKVHSIGFSEAYRRIGFLRRRRAWGLIMGESSTDPRRGAKDVPVLVSRAPRVKRIVDAGAFRACRAARPLRIAPERWVTWVVYRTRGGLLVLHVAVHPHAAVQHAARTSGRVRGYFRQWRRIQRLVRRQRKLLGPELHVVITGDVNATKDWGARWAPAAVFERLGLDVAWSRIDAVAYDSRLHLRRLRVIPPTQNGQDHPWLIATLTTKEH